MNPQQRIHLHLRCVKLRPNHAWFHAKGIGREISPLVLAALTAIAAQWLAWHLK